MLIFFITLVSSCLVMVFVFIAWGVSKIRNRNNPQANNDSNGRRRPSSNSGNTEKLSDDEMRLIQEFRKQKNEERIANAFSREEEKK